MISGAADGCQRIILPAYSYPAPPTTFWDGGIDAADPVQFLIANPATGPGERADPNYVAALARVKASGIRVMGYADTAYGAREAGLVAAEMDTWSAVYGVTDVFLDQTASSPDQLPYYEALAAHARARPGAILMLNPGNNVDEGYLQVADILNVFEGSQDEYAAFSPAEWTADHPTSRFAHLIYDVPDEAAMLATLEQSIAQRAGYVYITSDTLPNPWEFLPPYWTAEVARIRDACVAAAPG